MSIQLSRNRRPVTRQWHWHTISIQFIYFNTRLRRRPLALHCAQSRVWLRRSLNGFACIWILNFTLLARSLVRFIHSLLCLHPTCSHWHSLKQPSTYILPSSPHRFYSAKKASLSHKHIHTSTIYSKMSMDSNWSLDYCLACDRQTSGGAYCSQACRLGDLETSSCASSEAASPTSTGQSSFWASSMSPSKSGFYLQPAIDFGLYRSNHPLSSPDPRRPKSEYGTSYFPNTFQTQTPPVPLPVPTTKQTLTTSSSQSSLASMQSKVSTTSRNSGLSAQAKTELRNYANSFDLLRVWKRRMNST